MLTPASSLEKSWKSKVGAGTAVGSAVGSGTAVGSAAGSGIAVETAVGGSGVGAGSAPPQAVKANTKTTIASKLISNWNRIFFILTTSIKNSFKHSFKYGSIMIGDKEPDMLKRAWNTGGEQSNLISFCNALLSWHDYTS